MFLSYGIEIIIVGAIWKYHFKNDYFYMHKCQIICPQTDHLPVG